jgi:hypothetical protein
MEWLPRLGAVNTKTRLVTRQRRDCTRLTPLLPRLPSALTMASGPDPDASSPDVMLAYYKRLYPFKSIFNWLNHGPTPSKLFTHREFAFTLAGDVYLRYNSFSTAEDLKKQVCALNPTRFEIGPVYSARVRLVPISTLYSAGLTIRISLVIRKVHVPALSHRNNASWCLIST